MKRFTRLLTAVALVGAIGIGGATGAHADTVSCPAGTTPVSSFNHTYLQRYEVTNTIVANPQPDGSVVYLPFGHAVARAKGHHRIKAYIIEGTTVDDESAVYTDDPYVTPVRTVDVGTDLTIDAFTVCLT